MEDIIKTIITKKGARVSLVQPQEGRPFFRYEAGANALTDSFRYILRQHGQEDTATVTVNVDVPVEENTPRDHFNQQVNGFMKCVEKAMDGSPATLALTNLLGIDEGQPLNDDWIEQIFSNFRHFDRTIGEGEQSNFEDHVGRYIYVKDGYWDLEKADGVIELVFPSSPDALGNDTVFTIKNYQSTQVKLEDGLYNYPTHFHASLYIQDQPYFNLTLNGKDSEVETEYHSPSGIPIAFDLSFSADPYTLDVVLRNEGGQMFYPSISLKDRDGCKLAVNAELNIYGELSKNLSVAEINITNGNIQFNDLTFYGLETIWYAAQAEAESQEELDAFLHIICHYPYGQVLGKIRVQLEEQAVYLDYEDGTSQNLNELVMKFLDKYFGEDKPDGTARNQAFNIGEDKSYRSMAKAAPSLNGGMAKVGSKLAEGFRRRTSRGGVDVQKVIEVMDNFFVQERRGSTAPASQEDEMKRYEEEMKAQQEAAEKALREHEAAAAKAKEEAEAKAEAESKVQAEREASAKAAAHTKALKEAQMKAALEDKKKAEAAARAKAEAETKAKAQAAAEAKEKEAAAAAAKKKMAEAAAAKKLADAANAKRLAEEKAKAEAEKKAKAATAAKAEGKAKASAQNLAKADAKTATEEKPKAKTKPKGSAKAGSRRTGKRKPPGTGSNKGK